MNITGGSIVNESNRAANMTFLGVDRPAGTTGKVTVSSNADFIGVINAPTYNYTLSGSGNFYGSLIGNNMSLNGMSAVHYDEALSKTGGGYSVVSWFEDLR